MKLSWKHNYILQNADFRQFNLGPLTSDIPSSSSAFIRGSPSNNEKEHYQTFNAIQDFLNIYSQSLLLIYLCSGNYFL